MHHGTASEDPEHESEYYGGPSTPARVPPKAVESDNDDGEPTNRDDAPSPHNATTSGVDVRQLQRSTESTPSARMQGGGATATASAAAPGPRDDDGAAMYSPTGADDNAMAGGGSDDDDFANVAPRSLDRSPPVKQSPTGSVEPKPSRRRRSRHQEDDSAMKITSVRGDSAPPATPARAPADDGEEAANCKAPPATAVSVPAPPQRTNRKNATPRDENRDAPAPDCIHGIHAINDDSWRTKPARTHGCHRPFHIFQIVAWIVTCIVLLMSFLTTTRAIDDYDSTEDSHRHIPMHIAFGLFCLIGIGFGIAASAVDPTDAGDDTKEGVYCGTCQRRVHRSAKHCKMCNRCTHKFDHHCKWLNNCIGKHNYFFFFMYVAVLLACIVFGVTTTIYFLAKYWGVANAAEKAFGIICCVLYVAASVPLLHLCGFHMFLAAKGITTYQHLTGTS